MKKRPLIQPTFVPEDRPDTVTVTGPGLAAWCADPRVHPYRMDVVDNGVYTLHLLWLEGRQLLGFDAVPKPQMPRAAERRERVREAQAEFFK